MTTMAEQICADCRAQASQVEVRRRHLCHDCFQRYVSSKTLKRMETYRSKNQKGNTKKRLFLPISGGVSSLVLLHILDAQVNRQLAQQGRTAYELVIGHIVVEEGNDENALAAWWDGLQKEFTLHTYLPIARLSQVFVHDQSMSEDLQLLGLARRESESDEEFLSRIFISTRSATARSDMRELIIRRLIVSLAKQENCDSIIWAHSDSKLASKALAEVAKGRGGGVPNELADGLSPWGLTFNYPLRDLFKSELEIYLRTLPENVQECVFGSNSSEEAPVSLKMTSIDTLLSTYITSQGEKYPSIMANVVRTASKLQVPDPRQGLHCKLCAGPVIQTESRLCHGCERMKQDIKI